MSYGKGYIVYPEEKDYEEGEMPEMELEVGMYVNIYQKPLTREDFEGEALVTEIIQGPTRTNGLYEYTLEVFFKEDQLTVTRKVFLD